MATKKKAAKKRTARAIDPQMAKVKETLAKITNASIEAQSLNQREAAERMQEAQSQVSLLNTGKLRGFSEGRIMRYLKTLGKNITIVIEDSGHKSGKISVLEK